MTWYDLDIHCTNCGKALAGRFNTNHGQGYVISGAYPVRLRHQDGTTECVIRREPSAYDIFTANRAIDDAQKRAVGESQ